MTGPKNCTVLQPEQSNEPAAFRGASPHSDSSLDFNSINSKQMRWSDPPYLLPAFTRTSTWTLLRSCSCMPGTPGPTWSSASSGDSCSTGFLASGTNKHNTHREFSAVFIKSESGVVFWLIFFHAFVFLRMGTIIFSLFVCVGQVGLLSHKSCNTFTKLLSGFSCTDCV